MSNIWNKVQQYLKEQEEKIVKNQDSENAKPCDDICLLLENNQEIIELKNKYGCKKWNIDATPDFENIKNFFNHGV